MEQLLPQVDIYSFGVVLWELVTKEIPRRGALRDVRVPEECPQVRLPAMHMLISFYHLPGWCYNKLPKGARIRAEGA